MFLKFESAIAGANFSYAPGDVVEWPDDDEAARFCERGLAEELTPEGASEAARGQGKAVRRHRAPKPQRGPAPEAAARQAPERAARRSAAVGE